MRHPSKKLFVSIAALGLLASSAARGGIQRCQPRPERGRVIARGQAAIDRVGERLLRWPPSTACGRASSAERCSPTRRSRWTADQRLAYFDVAEPADAASSPSGSTAATADGDAFGLASLPERPRRIYLDFDGHVTTGTTWNSSSGRTSISSPAYTRDGDPSTFNADELQIIRETWAVVAEDFAPWNVNVTTIDPGVDALRRSGGADTQWGVRVVITGDDWNNCGCGGFAYLGSFDDTADEPAFVFNNSFAGVSEAASHEVGHTLLLNHDGLTSGTTYYRGHDTAGTPGWAPIMGASYYEPVTQWSRQEYVGANNQGEDDTAIIGSLTNGNNFGLRADDHGDTAADATPLTTQQVDETGIISTRTDVDVFSFTTSGGGVSFIADVAGTGPNLDVELTLRDAAGAVIASDNFSDALEASFDAQVSAGTFTVSIDGVGVGNPAINPPSGYTDYGSLGQYHLLGYIGGIGEPPPPDTEAPAAPTVLSAVETDGDVRLTWTANVESDLDGYEIGRGDTQIGPFATIASVGATASSYVDAGLAPGIYFYAVRAFDTSSNTSVDSGVAVVDVPEPPVDLATHATSDVPIAGSVSGTFAATATRGGVQTITEVDSGGKPRNRHDLAEHRWTIPASRGNQTLTVAASASSGTDADSGFAVEYSVDGSTWVPFAEHPERRAHRRDRFDRRADRNRLGPGDRHRPFAWQHVPQCGVGGVPGDRR